MKQRDALINDLSFDTPRDVMGKKSSLSIAKVAKGELNFLLGERGGRPSAMTIDPMSRAGSKAMNLKAVINPSTPAVQTSLAELSTGGLSASRQLQRVKLLTDGLTQQDIKLERPYDSSL